MSMDTQMSKHSKSPWAKGMKQKVLHFLTQNVHWSCSDENSKALGKSMHTGQAGREKSPEVIPHAYNWFPKRHTGAKGKSYQLAVLGKNKNWGEEE